MECMSSRALCARASACQLEACAICKKILDHGVRRVAHILFNMRDMVSRRTEVTPGAQR